VAKPNRVWGIHAGVSERGVSRRKRRRDLEADATVFDGGPCSARACNEALALSAGDGQTCALLAGGTVECWGDNEQGELGIGTTTNTPTPAAVTNLTGVTAIAAGAAHTCALLSGGTVQCWGYNQEGELGNGTSISPFVTPAAVSNLTGVTAIAAGAQHTCALLSIGTVDCWGVAYDGRLGTLDDRRPPLLYGLSWTPVSVSNLTGVTALSAGYSHTCALLMDRTVQCWGNNDYGQLGNGTTNHSTTPVSVSNLSGVTAIASGRYHACAVVSGGAVECWGANDYGQLGNGTMTATTSPVAASKLSGAAGIAAGRGDSCAVLLDGTVECWGYNQDGELGNGTLWEPVLDTRRVDCWQNSSITAGNHHFCALLSGGAVQCWGLNDSGQLGNATATNSSTPAHVSL